ncbi:MAG: carboxypeptidase-like regulatory domain-containing protein [bacterium]
MVPPRWTRRPPTHAWFLGVALAWLVAANTSSAQGAADIRGMVVDSVSGKPIAQAHIDVFEQSRSGPRILKAEMLTDDEGRFRIGVAGLPSSSLLGVRQVGFAPRVIRLDDLRMQDTLVVALAPIATSLGEVRIVEQGGESQRHLEVLGFVDRRRAGIGKFLDSAGIARSRATSLASLLRPYLKGCTMIYVNGVPGRLGDVEISHVIGIEIYGSNTEASPAFHNPIEGMGRCGSIVVWH